MKNLKPHGIEVSCGYEILGRKQSKSFISKMEAFIEIENLKMKSKLILPMRSFVNAFLDSFHGILSGDGGADTIISSASATATAASNVGLILGDGNVPVQLSDTGLISRRSATSSALTAIHKATTFNAPFSDREKYIMFDIRRLISNASTANWTIRELGVFSKGNASSAIKMLSRDHFPGEGILFPYNSDIRMTFRFISTQSEYGGVNMNFARAIYNLMFVGSINSPASRIIARVGHSQPTYTYNNNTVAASSNPIYAGASANHFNGIVIGYYNPGGGVGISVEERIGNPPPVGTPGLSIDETTFTISHTNISSSANEISSVQASTGSSKFTISRDFLNNSNSIKTFNRVGLLTRGNSSNLTALHDSQFFIAVNNPNITLEPQQTLRVTYTFSIGTGRL